MAVIPVDEHHGDGPIFLIGLGADRRLRRFSLTETIQGYLGVESRIKLPDLETAGHAKLGSAVAISQDGGMLVTGACDGTLHVYPLQGKRFPLVPSDVRVLRLHDSFVGGVLTIVIAGGRIFTAGCDGAIFACDGAETAALRVQAQSRLRSIGGLTRRERGSSVQRRDEDQGATGKTAREWDDRAKDVDEPDRPNELDILEQEAEEKEQMKELTLVSGKAIVRARLAALRSKVLQFQKMNEEVPELHKLPQLEFVLDLKRKEVLILESQLEVKRAKYEMMLQNAKKMLVRKRIREECWDTMQARGTAVFALANNASTCNFPLKQTGKQDRCVQIAKNLRLIELAELDAISRPKPVALRGQIGFKRHRSQATKRPSQGKIVAENVDSDKPTDGVIGAHDEGKEDSTRTPPSNPTSPPTAVLDSRKSFDKGSSGQDALATQQAEVAVAAAVATAADPQPTAHTTDSRDRQIAEDSEMADDAMEVTENDGEGPAEFSEPGDELSGEEDEPSDQADFEQDYAEAAGLKGILYGRFELETTKRKRSQMLLLRTVVIEHCKVFNQKFDEIKKRKTTCIDKISEINGRLSEIQKDLGNFEELFKPTIHNEEVASSIFEVKDSEVKVEACLSPEEKQRLLEQQGAEEDRLRSKQAGNMAERALKDMMDGMLTMRQDEDALDSKLERPEWMNGDRRKMTDEQLKLLKEFEAKEKVIKEEKQRRRKGLEMEYRKLKSDAQELITSFDDALTALYHERLKVEAIIYAIEMRIVRLAISIESEEDWDDRRERDSLKKLEMLKASKAHTTVIVADAARQVQKSINPLTACWDKTGCTFITDGSTDLKKRSVMNFLAAGEKGAALVTTAYMTGRKKNAAALVKLWEQVMREIGLKQINAICTDNAEANKKAAQILERRTDRDVARILWMPCGAHCCSLLLKDLSSLPWVKDKVKTANTIVKFIRNHHATHGLMMSIDDSLSLPRPTEVRFGQIGAEWDSKPHMDMWDHLYEFLREPVEGEVGTDEHMSTPIAIKQATRRTSADWWTLYGGDVPHLQQIAIEVLGMWSTTTPTERNWASMDFVHSKRRNSLSPESLEKRRNSLSPESLEKLVYIHWNMQLPRVPNSKDNGYVDVWGSFFESLMEPAAEDGAAEDATEDETADNMEEEKRQKRLKKTPKDRIPKRLLDDDSSGSSDLEDLVWKGKCWNESTSEESAGEDDIGEDSDFELGGKPAVPATTYVGRRLRRGEKEAEVLPSEAIDRLDTDIEFLAHPTPDADEEEAARAKAMADRDAALLEEVADVYNKAAAEDKAMDKSFKREFADCGDAVDFLYRIYRRRLAPVREKIDSLVTPRTGSLDKLPALKPTHTPGRLTPHSQRNADGRVATPDMIKAEREKNLAVDPVADRPERIDNNQWARFVEARNRKIAMEDEVAKKAEVVAVLQRQMQVLMDEDDANRRGIEENLRLIAELRENRDKKRRNMEIPILIKQGLVEIDMSPFADELARAILLTRSSVEDVNEIVRRHGNQKVEILVRIKNLKHGNYVTRWENRRLEMIESDTADQNKKLQLLRVTKALQAMIKSDGRSMMFENEVALLENRVEHSVLVREKHVLERQQHLLKMEKKARHTWSHTHEITRRVGLLQAQYDAYYCITHKQAVSKDPLIDYHTQHLMLRRRLITIATKQREAIASLSYDLDRVRHRTYPIFNHIIQQNLVQWRRQLMRDSPRAMLPHMKFVNMMQG
ncbi:hypothetical protein CBR_g37714 [Chara braunii]|uniref:HAT C-terminal dimerisation domain-containing protein n=1 Tax=Chara braunii TaxID=69332 RepID=A0A388K002_CHABU|nr:hypothetical protein CBR_g37714 [Chara braunii]|eukprot:GBG63357.1 hypothetical protein CBR_g37714 [Chara braunii]